MIIDSTMQTLGPAPATRVHQTPTQKQIEALASANDDQLIEKAVQALHALNYRATKIRNHKSEFRKASIATALGRETEFIHNLGATFLEALALAGRANVYTFELDRSEDDEPCERKCLLCDCEWVGSRWCYRCGSDITMAMPETLYVIDCGNGFRFHLAEASVSDEVRELAISIEPHDSRQPQRETPRVGLTVEAQKACVRLAIDRLARASTDSNDQPDRERINEEPFEIMEAPAGLDLQLLEHLPVAKTAQARSAIALARKVSVALDVLLDHCRASPYLVVHVEKAESGAPRYLIAASDLGAEWVCGLT